MPNELKKQERQMTFWESESDIVPQTAATQATETKPGNAGEGKVRRPTRDLAGQTSRHSAGPRFRTRLDRITQRAKRDKAATFAARDNQRTGDDAPGTFDFLGLTHYCGKSRAGKFKLKRRTSKKKFRQKVAALKDWFRTQLTTPIGEVWPVLNQKLRGHYQYYHVNDNWQYVSKYREAARRLGHRWMRRRSQKGQTSWVAYTNWLRHYPLAVPGKVTDLIAMARAAS